MCVHVRKKKLTPMPLVTRERATGFCLETNRKYLTVYRKLFEVL